MIKFAQSGLGGALMEYNALPEKIFRKKEKAGELEKIHERF